MSVLDMLFELQVESFKSQGASKVCLQPAMHCSRTSRFAGSVLQFKAGFIRALQLETFNLKLILAQV
jgi:hypothetical protein